MTTPVSRREFTYDAGDPTVGIFGGMWYHEACPATTEWADVGATDTYPLATLRINPTTVRTGYRLTCLDCGAHTLVYETEYDPAELELQESSWNQ